MHPDVGKLLHLQELDQRIAELRGEIASLPKQVAEIEKALDGHLKKLDADKAILSANQRDRKKLDIDVQTHQQKVSKLKDQMLGAKTNEQYRAFQKEIDYCEAEIRKAEDRTLELMEEAELLATNVKAAEQSLAQEKKVVEERKKEAAARTEVDKAELARCSAERAVLVASLPAGLVSTYVRLHKRMSDGRVVAKVLDDTCGACYMTIRPQHMADVRLSAEILACENCRRLLYVEPQPIDVAQQMND
ncbi:MAG: C4-type zinc ribbon domain-containing protein [Bryobacteraceae bacterium]|jgi:predicted  nucleic acid-binding Zn-ribbon protein